MSLGLIGRISLVAEFQLRLMWSGPLSANFATLVTRLRL